MKRRALVVGSNIQERPLRGVKNDIAAMQTVLKERGFAVEPLYGPSATRQGILDGYDRLIRDTKPEDAAVFYYAGHGSYARIAGRSLQFIAPSDLYAGNAQGEWCGITAWELSIKLHELTLKTHNATVILDCCHAAQMSRSSHEVWPRALAHPQLDGIDAHLRDLRRRYPDASDNLDPISNRYAVRFVACGQSQSAFEHRSTADDKYRGVFTDALVNVLRQFPSPEDDPEHTDISWAAVGQIVRDRVQRRLVTQRPDIEGPARRRLFSVAEDDALGIVTIKPASGGYRLSAGRAMGVVVGDVYGIMPVGAQAYVERAALGTLQVEAVKAFHAEARMTSGKGPLPRGSFAFPIKKHAFKRTVRVAVPEPARDHINREIAAARTLEAVDVAADTPAITAPFARVPAAAKPMTPAPFLAAATRPPDEESWITVAADVKHEAVATLRLDGNRLTIEDGYGPLFPPALYPRDLFKVVRNLANLGFAQAVRDLEGEHDVYERELAIELGMVHHGEPFPLPDDGAALGVGDRVYVKVACTGRRRLFVHIFNVGVRGKVTLLTYLSPSGVSIENGDAPFVLGETANGMLSGIPIDWPNGLPAMGFARLDEVFVIATTAQVNLSGLETREFVLERGAGTPLQRLLAQMQDGKFRDLVREQPAEGFFVKRLSYFLLPTPATFVGLPFELDENPTGLAAASEPDAWFDPRSDVAPPDDDGVPGWSNGDVTSAHVREDVRRDGAPVRRDGSPVRRNGASVLRGGPTAVRGGGAVRGGPPAGGGGIVTRRGENRVRGGGIAQSDEAIARRDEGAQVSSELDAIAIRLSDLIVEKNQALFSADVRIDAVICTRSANKKGGLATWTERFSGIRDGQRLSLENALLYLGPVRDFVDLSLFVSRDVSNSLRLAELFKRHATSDEFKDATDALVVAGGVAALPWVTAVGASAALARMAYELVLGVAGTSIGLYRTSFLRREQFGVGRHPHKGLYRAQSFSFSLAIEQVELQH